MKGLIWIGALFAQLVAADIQTAGRRVQQANEGQSLTIRCFAVERILKDLKYEDIEKVEWRKDGAIIASYSQMPTKMETWISDPRYSFDRSQFSLIVNRLRPDDTGQYKCWPRFRNFPHHSQGTHWHYDSINLLVIGTPTSPGRPNVLSYASRNVLLSWTASASHVDAPVNQYLIRSLTPHHDDSSVAKEDISPGNGTSWLITGLQPLTVYRFEVAAENFVGRGPFSASSYPIRTRGEAPDSPPRILSVYNNTNTSLIITWSHPPPSSLHGVQLAGYRLTVVSMESPDRKDFYISKPDYTTFEIPKLLPFTKYMITLEADNLFGFSPPATILVLSAEGVPLTGPTIIKAQVVSNFAVELAFLPPSVPRGNIIYYTLYLRQVDDFLITGHKRGKSQRNVIKIEVDEIYQRRPVQYRLENLDPCTNYSVSITASTSVGESVGSDTIYFTTDTIAPGQPTILNISLLEANSIVIEWDPPDRFCFGVDFYLLHLIDDQLNRRQINSTETYTILDGLVLFTRYTLTIRAATRSLLITDRQRYYVGPESSKTILSVQAKDIFERPGSEFTLRTSACPLGRPTSRSLLVDQARLWNVYCDFGLLTSDDIMSSKRNDSDSHHSETHLSNPSKPAVPVVVVAILGTFGLLILLVLLIMALVHFWRRYFGAKDCLAYAGETMNAASSRNGRSSCDYTEEHDSDFIGAEDFVAYVKEMHADSDAGFARLYERIEHVCATSDQFLKLSCEHSIAGDNKLKNRYVNILPYDHTRVRLKSALGIRNSDYINANFVDGFRQRRAYIATQGPLPNTIGDFWRMVWEHKCYVIVMITNIIERGRKKCEQYWPSVGEETYGGSYCVKLLNEHVTAFYAVRTFMLRYVKKKQATPEPSRVVVQYHCNSWPDHGIPECTPAILKFIEKSAAANQNSNAPIIVHCSAGVGRSGSYIVIDSMLRQVRATGRINVCGFLKRIRRQRMSLVQTEEQYIFCHDAIAEAILLGCTEIDARDFRRTASEWLLQPNSPSSTLKKQYEQIMSLKTSPASEAMKPYNLGKNRDGAVVPCDSHRVVIGVIPGEPGSDYVNATFLPGSHRSDEFIIAQFPIDETIRSFWQMVWEHGCRIVLILLKPYEDFRQFWPTDSCDASSIDYGLFSVGLLPTASLVEKQTCSELVLRSNRDNAQMSCELICCDDWATMMQDSNELWDFIHAVQELHNDGPLVVVDAFGGRDAATLCLLSALACQLDQESRLDVYTLARCYHERRPGVFREFTDYLYLFDCLDALVASAESKRSVKSAGSASLHVCDAAVKSRSLPSSLREKATTLSSRSSSCNECCQGIPKDTTL